MSYNLYGHLPEQRNDNTTLNHRDQKNATEYLVYTADTEQEAIAIHQAGGFVKEGQWYVVTRYESSHPVGLEPRDNAAGTVGNAEPTPLKRKTDASTGALRKRSV